MAIKLKQSAQGEAIDLPAAKQESKDDTENLDGYFVHGSGYTQI